MLPMGKGGYEDEEERSERIAGHEKASRGTSGFEYTLMK